MKKFFTTLCLAAIAALAFNANAQMWLVGDAFNGWNQSGNVEMTNQGDNIYTWSGDLVANTYFAFFKDTQDWGSQRGPANGNDSAPTGEWEDTKAGGAWKLAASGTYEIQYNYTTDQAKIAIVTNPDEATTIYITKTSIGNIWAWDDGGDYFDTWPGKPISELETATVGDVEYYSFTFTHKTVNMGIIFNDGTNQSSDMVPENGKLYNYEGGTIVQVSEPGAETPQPEESLSIRGSFNNWGETAMTAGENNIWTITQEMAAGAEFKFYNENGKWIGGAADGNFVITKEQVENGTALTLVVDGGNNFQIPVEGTWTLTVDKTNNTLVVSGDWVEQTIDPAMYIIGSFNEWNQDTQEAMTAGENNTWTITKTFEAGVTMKFRDEMGVWYGAEANNNFVVTQEQVENGTEIILNTGNGFNDIEIPVAGTWTFTITRGEVMTLVISGEWEQQQPVDPAMYIIGSFNEWNPETQEAMTAGENNTWSIVKTLEAGASFKLRNELNEWIGAESNGTFIMTEELLGTAFNMGVGDAFQDILIPVAGEWTITFDRENMQLTINGEWNEPIVEPGKVYILGEVNDNGGWFANVGTEMATEDGVTYTATITTQGENVAEGEEIGYSYFSFTTQLAENDDEGGWAYIEPFRFGAVSDGDFLVTPETLNIELDLTTENYQAYKIEAGKYNLTLNLTNMTLIISKADGIPGDVTGDQMVDVEDVNAIINIILKVYSANDYPGNADLDNNGIVDVEDMNAVINIILNHGNQE